LQPRFTPSNPGRTQRSLEEKGEFYQKKKVAMDALWMSSMDFRSFRLRIISLALPLEMGNMFGFFSLENIAMGLENVQ